MEWAENEGLIDEEPLATTNQPAKRSKVSREEKQNKNKQQTPAKESIWIPLQNPALKSKSRGIDVDEWLGSADLGQIPEDDFAIPDSDFTSSLDPSLIQNCERKSIAKSAFWRVNHIIQQHTNSATKIAKDHENQDALPSPEHHRGIYITETSVPVICEDEPAFDEELDDPQSAESTSDSGDSVGGDTTSSGPAVSSTLDASTATLTIGTGVRLVDPTVEKSDPPTPPKLSVFETALALWEQ